jgi:hypothetical protein
MQETAARHVGAVPDEDTPMKYWCAHCKAAQPRSVGKDRDRRGGSTRERGWCGVCGAAVGAIGLSWAWGARAQDSAASLVPLRHAAEPGPRDEMPPVSVTGGTEVRDA